MVVMQKSRTVSFFGFHPKMWRKGKTDGLTKNCGKILWKCDGWNDVAVKNNYGISFLQEIVKSLCFPVVITYQKPAWLGEGVDVDLNTYQCCHCWYI